MPLKVDPVVIWWWLRGGRRITKGGTGFIPFTIKTYLREVNFYLAQNNRGYICRISKVPVQLIEQIKYSFLQDISFP
jgi:hypothetical protein